MRTKTMSTKRIAAATIAIALVVGASVAFASPAFATPTPAPDPTTTISNLAVSIVQDAAGRQAFVQYNYTIDDPTLPSDSIAEITTFNSCDTPTVVDQDVALPSALGGGVSFYVTLPSDGYVQVVVYSSNGAAAPLVSAPAFASDQVDIPSNVGASFSPNSPPATGTYEFGTGNAIPVVHYQLYANGAPTGSLLSLPGCDSTAANYSAAAGTTLTLHVVEGDFDAATTTIPGGDPAALTRLPITGVGPGSWYAGGAGLAALLLGVVLLTVQLRSRRRKAAILR